MLIRTARSDEAPVLDGIALAAKAHWGYSTTQLAAWAPDLRTDPATIASWPTLVAEVEGQAVAFGQLDPTRQPWELVALFVLPAQMGRGLGKALLDALAHHAARAGVADIHIDSDPHAAGFYRACGAVLVGAVAAPVPDDPARQRPQLRWPVAGGLPSPPAPRPPAPPPSTPHHPLPPLPPALPANPGVAEFDALQQDPGRWIGVAAALGARHGGARAVPAGGGTVLVALLGREQVLKLYPPFLRDHFEFERAMLAHLHGRLSLPTPRLLDSAEHAGWPYLVMTQLPGTPLDRVWPALPPHERCAVLRTIGRVAAEVHALPLGTMPALAPRWDDFLHGQRARCHARQQRTGLPAHLLAQLDAFVQGPVPAGPDVLLTGEYTPFNLLYENGRLSAMFDFGDGLVGPREYDWLGPLCFLAAGDASRIDAFFEGYHGRGFDRSRREALLRLLLLHRYSHLEAQIAVPGWPSAPDFATLAARVWP